MSLPIDHERNQLHWTILLLTNKNYKRKKLEDEKLKHWKNLNQLIPFGISKEIWLSLLFNEENMNLKLKTKK